MDIDLFSDIVKNLIVDNDEIALPGLGTFVSELKTLFWPDFIPRPTVQAWRHPGR